MTNRLLPKTHARITLGLAVTCALALGSACGGDDTGSTDTGTAAPDSGSTAPADTGNAGGTDAGIPDTGPMEVCEQVATGPGTWDVTFELQSGELVEFTELGITQIGCDLIMFASGPGQNLGLTGPLSENGGWTGAAVLTDTEGTVSFQATFTGTFSGGPPYTALTIDSGNVTSGDGEAITGGTGELTE